ncbi:hypothetical protein GKE82_24075 [Conexibacter sp. W3-3-2]|uniref:hypothetical protein n=1 Tax=Conexibacter sp. W3-3-2 TaxID=2675227 RepID=UPI0012BA33BF|nr:hypothetical protein [Conexibacter sp. W3-3-2]MTD47286.1 hypothetical protein [Conexibacter sp. W3-3-2]
MRYSEAARGEHLITTGRPAPAIDQRTHQLQDLTAEQRARIVDLARRLHLHTSPDPSAHQLTGLGDLHRPPHDKYTDTGDARWRTGDAISLALVPAADGQTSIARTIHTTTDPHASALRHGAPVVDELDPPIDTVLDAYEHALACADAHTAQARAHAHTVWALHPGGQTDPPQDLQFLAIPGADGRGEILARAAHPDLFDQAVELLHEIAGHHEDAVLSTVPDTLGPALAQLDADSDPWVRATTWITALKAHLEALQQDRKAAAHDQAYAEERDAWIHAHGSPRLRAAHAGDYKLDLIYRQERLAREGLDGMLLSLGRRAKIREALNPSAAALDLEQLVRDWAHKPTTTRAAQDPAGPEVRIVWAAVDLDDVDDGEMIQVKAWLGRHRLWLPVEPQDQEDDR